jgi:hypothetical protein
MIISSSNQIRMGAAEKTLLRDEPAGIAVEPGALEGWRGFGRARAVQTKARSGEPRPGLGIQVVVSSTTSNEEAHGQRWRGSGIHPDNNSSSRNGRTQSFERPFYLSRPVGVNERIVIHPPKPPAVESSDQLPPNGGVGGFHRPGAHLWQ